MRAPADLQRPFDRVTYRDGQLLASRDLQDDVRANQRLRGLHTRYLHGTWGIALGFEVSAGVSDTAVRVGPGYAIDEQGHELVLAETLDVPVPESSTPTMFVLVMTWQSDTGFAPKPDVNAVCLGEGLNPRNERPVIAWRRSDQVRFGPEVPLAAAVVNNGALIAPLSLSVRRYAARQIRPHVGFATIVPHLEIFDGGFSVDVDTSEAGFTTTPVYVVKLEIEPATPVNLAALATLLPFAFVRVAEAARFQYVIPIRRRTSPGIAIGGPAPGVGPFAVNQPAPPVLKLSWVGFEPVSGCEPHVNPLFIFSLAGLRINIARFASIATSSTIKP
jgi:hypothetical protein